VVLYVRRRRLALKEANIDSLPFRAVATSIAYSISAMCILSEPWNSRRCQKLNFNSRQRIADCRVLKSSLLPSDVLEYVKSESSVRQVRHRAGMEGIQAFSGPHLTFRTSPDDYPRISPRAKSGGGIPGQCGSLARPCAGGLCRAS
jgi:hypothetical protein